MLLLERVIDAQTWPVDCFFNRAGMTRGEEVHPLKSEIYFLN